MFWVRICSWCSWVQYKRRSSTHHLRYSWRRQSSLEYYRWRKNIQWTKHGYGHSQRFWQQCGAWQEQRWWQWLVEAGGERSHQELVCSSSSDDWLLWQSEDVSRAGSVSGAELVTGDTGVTPDTRGSASHFLSSQVSTSGECRHVQWLGAEVRGDCETINSCHLLLCHRLGSRRLLRY